MGTIHRPPPYRDGALPLSYARSNKVAPRRGFEPRSSWLTARRSTNCAIGNLNWTRRSDSNGRGLAPSGLQPDAFGHLATSRCLERTTDSNRKLSALEAAALPIELARYGWWVRMDSNYRVLMGDCFIGSCDRPLCHTPVDGTSCTTRTCDLRLRRPAL